MAVQSLCNGKMYCVNMKYHDEYGLPCQDDGDRNDQLQRVGFWLVGSELLNQDLNPTYIMSLYDRLQPRPGVYVRFVGGNPDNVSCDQLMGPLCYWVLFENRLQLRLMIKAMLKRFGFAQNVVDGLNGDNTKRKIPDFMLIRVLPLILRYNAFTAIFTWVADILLVLGVLFACGPVWKDYEGFKSRNPNDVDDLNLIMTLVVCRAVRPTLFSIMACKLYWCIRPWNFGCADVKTMSEARRITANGQIKIQILPPVIGSLKWYFRPETGANAQFGDMWSRVCWRYLR